MRKFSPNDFTDAALLVSKWYKLGEELSLLLDYYFFSHCIVSEELGNWTEERKSLSSSNFCWGLNSVLVLTASFLLHHLILTNTPECRLLSLFQSCEGDIWGFRRLNYQFLSGRHLLPRCLWYKSPNQKN